MKSDTERGLNFEGGKLMDFMDDRRNLNVPEAIMKHDRRSVLPVRG